MNDFITTSTSNFILILNGRNEIDALLYDWLVHESGEI